nr:MAG TPA: hypothetical protein [Caudoviricetes sp.]
MLNHSSRDVPYLTTPHRIAPNLTRQHPTSEPIAPDHI